MSLRANPHVSCVYACAVRLRVPCVYAYHAFTRVPCDARRVVCVVCRPRFSLVTRGFPLFPLYNNKHNFPFPFFDKGSYFSYRSGYAVRHYGAVPRSGATHFRWRSDLWFDVGCRGRAPRTPLYIPGPIAAHGMTLSPMLIPSTNGPEHVQVLQRTQSTYG